MAESGASRPSPPTLRDVDGCVAVIYYDIPRPGKPNKRILLLPEYHEVRTPQKGLVTYLRKLSSHVNSPAVSSCLDVHIEQPHTWFRGVRDDPPMPIDSAMADDVEDDVEDDAAADEDAPTAANSDDNNNQTGGDMSSFAAVRQVIGAFAQYTKLPVRLHSDDVRGFRAFAGKNMLYVRHDSGKRPPREEDRMSRDDYLALTFGVGPSATGRGEPRRHVRRRFDALGGAVEGTAGARMMLDWGRYALVRRRARKTLREFAKQHPSVKPATLVSAFRSAMAFSDRGPGFAFEAVGDIYAFLRMFRTFTKKEASATGGGRRVPCKQEDQTNIIYSAHMGHVANLMLLLWKVFRVEPTWYESTRSARTFDPVVPTTLAAIKRVRSNTRTTPYPNFQIHDWPNKRANPRFHSTRTTMTLLMSSDDRATPTVVSNNERGEPELRPPPFFP